jgi:hypothetical protein
MEYKVYNERNIKVIVTDEQLEEVLDKNGKELPIEILRAMKFALKPCFSAKFQEAINHEKKQARIVAIYGLLSLLDKANLAVLQEKEQSIPDDLKEPISEKAILQAVIIRLEKGPEGTKNAFFEGDISPLTKSLLISNYSSSNMPLLKEDVEFLINALEAYANKSQAWIQKTQKGEYDDDIISGLEGLVRASEETSLLSELDASLCEKLSVVCAKFLEMKIDLYTKELIAEFARALPPKVAYKMLEPIMDGRAKGDVRKELNISLQILRQKEQNEEKTNGA